MPHQRQQNLTAMISLYTLCPECKKEYTITAKQLRVTRAIVECKHCQIKFDALEYLNDAPVQRQLNPFIEIPVATLPPLPWEQQQNQRRSLNWSLASCLAAVVLMFQIYWFQSHNLVQHPSARPWLEGICSTFNCTVPAYDNLDQIKIVHGNLQAINKRQLKFQLVFGNEAIFRQNLPKIKLTLLRFNGDAFGERTFSAKQYLKNPGVVSIKAGEQIEIEMILVQPKETIGGYKIELL